MSITSTTGTTPPDGRYGTTPGPGARRLQRALVVLLGLGAVALAVWTGLGAGAKPVTWKDVGFTVGDGDIEIVYDVIRPDPSVEVRCRLHALNQQHAQVGVVVVDIGPAEARTVRLASTVAVSEPAVTGVVESCWTP
ncbi:MULTISPECIES: DUF4307 domain-containing protein [unclassified Actinotalea]|uniref:DUF4307 domain-containing protein n=1 Tax=unclassified Actinotalea TaxID=2638618 RepID=UPI0015F48AAB|nr:MULTISPECIES: DUF4307 domain-containing protein [unclassified Actinotalea]